MNPSTTLPPTRARRRPGTLGAVLAGLVLASAAIAGTPAPAAAQDCTTAAPLNECIPGGASARLDCLQEWLTLPKTTTNYRGIPKPIIKCIEGDPNCDDDPDFGNGLCTFRTQICINNTDPRLPKCSPTDVSTFEFDQRDRNANDPADAQNKDNIEWELGFGGLGPYIVQDQKLVYSGAVNDTPNLCSGEIQLFVPMKQRADGTYKKARRRFRVRAAASDGRVDVDTFTYWCLPSRCGDGFLEKKVEQCDDGNRINGDGCDQGCYIEPPPTPTPTPSPTPVPTETPTPTPEPTQTPIPTETPEHTPEPTPSPTPSPTPTPTPTPAPTLGVWSFGVATGNSGLCPGTALSDGSLIKSAGMPGSNTTAGGSACSISRGNFAVDAPFQLVGGSIDANGIAPIQFNGARVVRVQEPSASSNNWVCLRVESNGPGWVDCDGGTDSNIQATVNSNLAAPPGPPAWDESWLSFPAGGTGAGAAQIPVSVRLQRLASCPNASDSSWDTIDAINSVLTTGQAVSQIQNPLRCPGTVVIFSCPSGSTYTNTMPSTASLSCASWTTQTNKTFQTPLFFLDSDFGSGNVGDMALVARLRTSP